MESGVHASVPLRVGKKMRKRRELDALVGGGGGRGGRLLSGSSDEGEPWARRTTRRRRARPFVRLAAGLALCICVVSAATVLWLFVDVRRQIVSLRIEMDRVSTSSNGVNDGLQFCHTAAQELRGNASQLSDQLTKLKKLHEDLSKRVDEAAGQLAAVSEQLAAAPKLADTPRRLAELQRTVADFGSQINGFDSALKSAHKQALAATTGLEEVKSALHDLELKTNATIANVTATVTKEDELTSRIGTVNDTLSARVETLQHRIEEATRTTSTPMPTTTTTTTAASTAEPTTTSTTSTTTLAPDPKAKPNILQ